MKKLLPLFLLCFHFNAVAQLTLDTSFGDNGYVLVDWPTTGIARMYAQLQPDGKIIVSGNHIGSIPREGYIFRLKDDGSMDLSYGTDGYYIIPTLVPDQDVQGPDIYLLPDNSLIAYSSSYGSSLVKLTPQGTIDPGFVQNGGSSSFNSQEFSILDAQQTYLYLIESFPPHNGLQRFSTATGLLDTSFGNAQHSLAMPVGFNSDSEAAVQADGKVTIIRETHAAGENLTYVYRILPNGTPDPDFGTNGFTLLYGTTESSSEREECMVYDEAGSLYIASRNWETFDNTAIYKLDANGAPVLTFGTNGKIVLPDNYFVLDVYVHDGHLYALGRKMLSENFNDCNLLLAKYSLDGQPDTNFGTNGIFTEDSNPYLESGEDVVFTADGGIVVVGETNETGLHRAYAVKYLPQALQTQNFKTDVISYQNPIHDVLTVYGKGVVQIALFGIDGKAAGFAFGPTVATGSLARGLYFARVYFESGPMEVIKVLKE